MSVTDASAACTVTAASAVDCLADTFTANTTNLNGGTAASSDRRQEFDNGSNITGTVASNVTVSGAGLQLVLTNVPPPDNTIGFTNSGTVTSNQNNALELIGNGGLVSYTGSGTVSATAGGSNALAVTNIGAGGVSVTNNGTFSSGAVDGLFIHTQGPASLADLHGNRTPAICVVIIGSDLPAAADLENAGAERSDPAKMRS